MEHLANIYSQSDATSGNATILISGCGFNSSNLGSSSSKACKLMHPVEERAFYFRKQGKQVTNGDKMTAKLCRDI